MIFVFHVKLKQHLIDVGFGFRNSETWNHFSLAESVSASTQALDPSFSSSVALGAPDYVNLSNTPYYMSNTPLEVLG